MEIPDGNNNVTAIRSALDHAGDHTGQPVFINVTTTIGLGTSVAGTSKAHHAAFGPDNVAHCKKMWNLDVNKTHQIPREVKDYWFAIPKRGARAVREWNQLLAQYHAKHPELAVEFRRRAAGSFHPDWKQSLLDFQPTKKDTPIRQSSAEVYDHLWDTIPLFAGSADLSEPNFTLRKAKGAFGPAHHDGKNASFDGRYIHYGTREHGMIAMANGIAAYSQGAFIPVTATFAMFQLYGASALRMTALSKLQVIHIGTHDSIAEGACGPTHQVRIRDIRILCDPDTCTNRIAI
jgi:dihydroxyacetone synthase